jgi:xanthine dehydrogenase accessory factor
VTSAAPPRLLVAVYASPVAASLSGIGGQLGFRVVLVEPDPRLRNSAAWAEQAVGQLGDLDGDPELGAADVVVTDHHRDDLGAHLRDALARPVRWIGILGNPRHEGPHVAALATLGVPPEDVARVHRPIGLDIGSRTSAEIAVATLAGLLADRNGRPGGFLDR